MFDAYSVHVVGMQGMGDNLHQRAIIRQLMATKTVYLETPWPCIYHDLVGPRLRLLKRPTALRTQAKNATREQHRYNQVSLPKNMPMLRVWYTGDQVRANDGSIFKAMVANAKCDVDTADFRLPVPREWQDELAKVLDVVTVPKPILLYRPLVSRTEWVGCAGRNPDYAAYAEIFSAIRDLFFVVSVADLVPNVEWQVGQPIQADVEFHHGELRFEQLAALMQAAALCYASPGFATILAQAVGTPAICVFGGHECSLTIATGAKFAPTLGIDPIEPCNCFSHSHPCKKRIDIPRAVARVWDFVERECALH